jgi:DNA-binding NarL/FixJ family response regulator
LAPPPGAIFRISWTSRREESKMEFTPRELGVLRLVARGYIPLEIAEQTGLHRVAVTLTVRKLAAKVGVASMAALERKAREIT